jgi:hypothetical protein
VVADDIVDRGRLVHILADHVVSGQDCNLIGLWRPLATILLADDPDARVWTQRWIRVWLRFANDQVFDAVHLLQACLEGLAVGAHFPDWRVHLGLLPQEAILAGRIEEGRFAEDGVD